MSEAKVGSKRRRPRWLFEGVLIVASVLLGFGAAQYGEYRGDRQLADRILTSVAAEIEHNRALLEPMVPFHLKWLEVLALADISSRQSALDVWFATRPDLPDGASVSFPMLRRSAWDAALASGATRLIDYDVIAAASEIYRMQEITIGNVDRLANGALSAHTTYDPASSEPAVRLLWLTLADIEAAERMLLDLYARHLPVIRAAARTRPPSRP